MHRCVLGQGNATVATVVRHGRRSTGVCGPGTSLRHHRSVSGRVRRGHTRGVNPRNGCRPRRWHRGQARSTRLSGSFAPAAPSRTGRTSTAAGSKDIVVLVTQCNVEGVSPRRIADVVKSMGIARISKSQVSDLAQVPGRDARRLPRSTEDRCVVGTTRRVGSGLKGFPAISGYLITGGASRTTCAASMPNDLPSGSDLFAYFARIRI